MHRHTLRTILIYATIVVALIQIYPTIGWMTLSPDERQARLKQWQEEDAVYHKPNLWRETSQSVRRWAQCDRDRVINLGLDLQGGIHMVLSLDMDKADPKAIQQRRDQGQSDADMLEEFQNTVRQRIWRRVDEFEAKEPIIQTLGNSQVQVQLPGEKDVQRARNLIMKTAYLTFHMVAGWEETRSTIQKIGQRYPDRFLPFLQKPRTGAEAFRIPRENVEQVRRIVEEVNQTKELLPENKVLALSQPPNPWDEPFYDLYLMETDSAMTGEGLRTAVARQDPERGGMAWMILFEWDAQSAIKFGDVTQANLGRNMAIVLDDVVVSAPTIQSRITERGQITGNFSREQAQDLAIALSSGSMPVPIREEYTAVVGPSLGEDSIRKGLMSSLVSVVGVMVFMLWYYRLAGIIANVSLIVNSLLMMGLLAYGNATLTLPGIAGFILTLGMAVDGNVLIYERIREEIRNGKSLAASIDNGFSRASVTIIDSQLTTLLAAVVLFQFGTGPIQGFAVALSVGIVCSIFTAIVVSRAQFDFLTTRKWVKTLTMVSLIKPDTKIRFLDRKYPCLIVSGTLIVIGLAAFVFRGSDNFGVDFTTGTNMVITLNSDQAVGVGDVRSKLTEAGFRDVIVQEYGDRPKQFLIRVSEVSGANPAPAAPPASAASSEAETVEGAPAATEQTPETQTVSGRVQLALAPLCGAVGDISKVVLEEVQTIGPAVGDELKMDALQANVYSWIFMIIYLWFRFELKFGVAAVVALIHDVLITVGFFALTGREITMPVVAALLTIIGFSVNDTIVLFDRVRENLKLFRGRGLSYAVIMDTSVNQTLSRTILTSMTVFLVVVVLFFIGGDVLHDFAFAMIVGVVVGTYSSIFIASPLVLLWMWIQQRRTGVAGGSGEKKDVSGRRYLPKEKERAASKEELTPAS
ncbi:MAG: protein translocase subunit SecD [Candidatus Hydrogenedentes bacterium]|nr:protein translocase subunit SecD [Candidatus Hydrogenedentota bacterium]